MHRRTAVIAALALSLATVVAAQDAHALEPLDVEIGAKVGYATTNVSATAFTGDFGGRGETVTFDPGPSGAGLFFVTRLGVGERR